MFLRRVACASIHILIHDPASSFTISPARCPLSVCVSPFSHTSHARSPHVNMSDRAQTVHTLHTLGSSPRPSSVQACPPRHCRPVVSAEIKCAGRVMLSSAGTHRHHGAADLPPTSRRPPVRSASEPVQSKGVGGSEFRGAPHSRAGQARWRRRPGEHIGEDRGSIRGPLAPALALTQPYPSPSPNQARLARALLVLALLPLEALRLGRRRLQRTPHAVGCSALQCAAGRTGRGRTLTLALNPNPHRPWARCARQARAPHAAVGTA